ncbi:MAG: ferredoxin [Magnetococcales bacterium]|nr:ferredoxin [Magnetococcales bacterium]
MALSIAWPCTGCTACLPLCPNAAILIQDQPPGLGIDPGLCTECTDLFAAPQCGEICPVEEALLDDDGVPLHPLGSLTGVPAALRLDWSRRRNGSSHPGVGRPTLHGC